MKTGMSGVLETVENVMITSKCQFVNCGDCVFYLKHRCQMAVMMEITAQCRKAQIKGLEEVCKIG